MEYIGEEDLEAGCKDPKPYLPDLHLKTAIRIHERKFLIDWLKDPSSICPRDIAVHARDLKLCLTSNNYFNVTISLESESIYHLLLNIDPSYIDNQVNQSSSLFSREEHSVTENLSVVKNLISTMESMIIPEAVTKNKRGLDSRSLNHYTLSPYLRKLHIYRKQWVVLRDLMQSLQIRRRSKFFKPTKLVFQYDIMYNSNYLIIFLDDQAYLLAYDQVLMVCDTLSSRYLSVLYCDMCSHSNLNYVPSVSALLHMYKWGDDCLKRYGNNAYDLFKNFEAICTGVMLDLYEPLPISKDFLKTVLTEGVNQCHQQDAEHLVKILREEFKEPSHLFEAFGCFRHFGHPTVDEESGCESFQKNTRMKLEMDRSIIKGVSASFNKNFIIQFIKKNNRWPKCTFVGDKLLFPRIKKIVDMKLMSFSEFEVKEEHEGWSDIKFEKELEYDDFPDFTILLSDTSVSPYRPNLVNIYHPDLVNLHARPMTETRRTLLEILRREEISCKSIREIIQDRKVPLTWLIVGLHSKEREEKINSRLFAMLCLEMRLYFNMTEKNLSESLFKYIPQQTMTWDEADIMKTLLNITTSQASENSDSLEVVISLDFTKWNQRWRRESTSKIFTTIDQLFGTPKLYTYSHEFFESATFYLSSRLCPPEFLRKKKMKDQKTSTEWESKYRECNKTWMGQRGGCEGLRQKGWTPITIAALLYAEHLTGLNGKIIGQGDNQVIVLSLPKPNNVLKSDYIENFKADISNDILNYLKVLDKIMKGIGMELKIQESWVSLHHLNYGKEIIVDGVLMSSGLKRISRAYQEVSDALPTIDNKISSLYTAAQATSMKSFDMIIPYMISTLEVLSLFDKESIFGNITRTQIREALLREKVEMSYDLKLFLLILPKDFGGYQIMPFTEFLFRGHPDPLTSQLVWIKELGKSIPMAQEVCRYISLAEGIRSEVQPLMLIKDPLSINWNSFSDHDILMKNALLSAVIEYTNNRAVKTMFNSYDDKSLADLVGYLDSLTPCSPRVMNEIFRLSPEGAKWSFLSTFTDMRTMKNMVSGHTSRELYSKVIIAEEYKFTHIVRLFKDCKRLKYTKQNCAVSQIAQIQDYCEDQFSCTTSLAQLLRDFGWKKPIEGVTTPHPFEQFALLRGDDCPRHNGPDGDEYIIYNLLDSITPCEPGKSPLLKRGVIRPYWGSGTSEKRTSPLVSFPKTDRSLKAAQLLSRMRGWVCERGSSLDDLLKTLISTRTELDSQIVELISGQVYGGSQYHRFSDIITKKAGRPSIRGNAFTRIYFSSDPLGKYSKGQENYYMFFQGIFLTAMTQISCALNYNVMKMEDFPVLFHQHPRCTGCLKPIIENPIRTNSSIPKIQTAKGCPLIFSTVTEISSRVSWVKFDKSSLIRPESPQDYTQERVCLAIATVLTSEIRNNMSPILHGYSNDAKIEEKFFSSITVGLISKINVKLLFQSLAKTLVLDNLQGILSIAEENCTSLLDGITLFLLRIPEASWGALIPLISLPPARIQISEEYSNLISSSEFFITGRGIASVLKKILSHEIRSIRDRWFWKINLLFKTDLLDTNRALRMWVCSCFLIAFWKSKKQLADSLNEFITVLDDKRRANKENNIQDSAILIIILYLNFRAKYPQLPCPIKDNPLRFSAVGPEPWMMHTPMVVEPRPEPEIRPSHWLAIKGISKRIGINTQINISASTIKEVDWDSIPIIINNFNISNKREIHKYRLIGRYSSAFLKYIQIYSIYDLTQIEAAVHLAEGSGSLLRFSNLVLGARDLYYCSLIDTTRDSNQRMVDLIPGELNDIPTSNYRLAGARESFLTGGDLSKPKMSQHIFQYLRNNRDKIGLLTSDAEIGGEFAEETTLRIVKQVLEYSKELKLGSLVVIKTFCWHLKTFLVCVDLAIKYLFATKVIVPSFSSNTSSEIFISGRSRGSFNKNYHLSSSDADDLVDSLLNRISPVLRLDSIDPILLRGLYEKLMLDKMYFNPYHALSSLLKGVVEEADLEKDPMEACSRAKIISYNLIISRLKAISNLKRVNLLDHLEELEMTRKIPDLKEILSLSENIFNSDVIVCVLSGKDPLWLWEEDMVIMYRKKPVFRYRPNMTEWMERYDRHYFKLIGFYHTYLAGRCVSRV